MTSLDYDNCQQFAWDNRTGLSSDAVSGFASISENLCQVQLLPEIRGTTSSDILAIAMGWVVLGLVIYYPAIQLAAIAASAVLFAAVATFRSFVTFIRRTPLWMDSGAEGALPT